MTILRIEVERLKIEPIECNFELSPMEFDLLDDPEYRFEKPIVGQYKAQMAGHHNVYLHGTLSTTVKAACVRCLQELEFPVEVEVKLAFLSRDEMEKHGETVDKDDPLIYHGDAIYPLEQLREELMVALPQLPKCSYADQKDCPHWQENISEEPKSKPEPKADNPAPNDATAAWQNQLADIRKKLSNEEASS